jgi:hypothetical protein
MLMSSCTWLVWEDLSDTTPPCSGPEDCFAGQRCVEGACADDSPPPTTPPSAQLTVGPAGGEVAGPDGARLIVPAGALESDVALRLERASASLIPTGFESRGPLLSIRPPVTFDPPAVLEVPLEPDVCADGECRVWRWPVGTRVRADVTTQGSYGVGPAAAPPDAGAVDAGGGDAGGTLDAGSPDAGVSLPDAGPPGFASCDFSPTSCPTGESCVAHPFAPGGLCLRSCEVDAGAADGCACCGTLPGDGSPRCLPAALCGAAALGDACPGGVDDCAPASADSCVDLGAGPVCTLSCDADNASSRCGDGCCTSGSGGGVEGFFCAAAPACGSSPVGARCAEDSGCDSGRCDSIDGSAPARCTETCTPGSCGAGLCCFPQTCGGDSLCVLDDVCQAVSEEICGGLCVDDSACEVGERCVNGSCEVPACECTKHAHCGADERCELGDAGACGSCVPRAADECFVDDHCPSDAGPDARLCEKPPGCGADPDAQCAGSCAAPDPGACVVDDDCAEGLACLEHLCF